MKTKSKLKLANLTTWIMLITITIIAIWFIGFIVENTFDLNVFSKKTSDFMYAFIGFSFVLIFCSAILNISLNIGLIADSKVQELSADGTNIISKKLYLIILIGIAALVSFLFIGDYLTREKEEKKLIDAAEYILDTYSTSIDKIGPNLKDTLMVDQIPEILKFLSNQKSEFPSISILTSGEYDDQLTFLEISRWDSGDKLKEPMFNNSFYKCKEYDCDYLHEIFTGQTEDDLFWTKKNDYKYYFPILENDVKYILVFSKKEYYGKIGSRGSYD